MTITSESKLLDAQIPEGCPKIPHAPPTLSPSGCTSPKCLPRIGINSSCDSGDLPCPHAAATAQCPRKRRIKQSKKHWQASVSASKFALASGRRRETLENPPSLSAFSFPGSGPLVVSPFPDERNALPKQRSPQPQNKDHVLRLLPWVPPAMSLHLATFPFPASLPMLLPSSLDLKNGPRSYALPSTCNKPKQLSLASPTRPRISRKTCKLHSLMNDIPQRFANL